MWPSRPVASPSWRWAVKNNVCYELKRDNERVVGCRTSNAKWLHCEDSHDEFSCGRYYRNTYKGWDKNIDRIVETKLLHCGINRHFFWGCSGGGPSTHRFPQLTASVAIVIAYFLLGGPRVCGPWRKRERRLTLRPLLKRPDPALLTWPCWDSRGPDTSSISSAKMWTACMCDPAFQGDLAQGISFLRLQCIPNYSIAMHWPQAAKAIFHSHQVSSL